MNKRVFGLALATSVLVVSASPLAAMAETTTVVTPAHQQGWYTRATDTATGSQLDYVVAPGAPLGSGALELTTSSSNDSVVHYTHDFSVALKNVNKLSYATKQLSAADQTNGNATMRVSVNLTGGTTEDDQLMYEPYYNGFNGSTQTGWQNWDLTQGKFWSNYDNTYNSKGGVEAGSYDSNFTLADVLHDYPKAKVVGLVLSMGTYNPSQQVLADAVRLNGNVYDFEVTNVPTNKNQCKDGGYVNYTDTNGNAFKNQGDCVSFFGGSKTVNKTKISVTNTSSQTATSGNATSSGNTSSGNARSGDATPNNASNFTFTVSN